MEGGGIATDVEVCKAGVEVVLEGSERPGRIGLGEFLGSSYISQMPLIQVGAPPYMGFVCYEKKHLSWFRQKKSTTHLPFFEHYALHDPLTNSSWMLNYSQKPEQRKHHWKPRARHAKERRSRSSPCVF